MKSSLNKLKAFSLGKKIALSTTTVVLTSAIASAAVSPNNDPRAEIQKPQGQIQKEKPSITTETVTETVPIPFEKTTTNDPNLNKGATALKMAGVNGTKTLTYELTFKDGQQTDKKLISEDVTTQPTAEVLAIGTHISPPSNCHSSYSGACVPITSDVDCIGGSGNGPSYIGTVTVVGPDVYDLDRDGDGLGCE